MGLPMKEFQKCIPVGSMFPDRHILYSKWQSLNSPPDRLHFLVIKNSKTSINCSCDAFCKSVTKRQQLLQYPTRPDASPVSVDINDPSLTGHSMTETGSRFTDRYASFTQITKLSARHTPFWPITIRKHPSHVSAAKEPNATRSSSIGVRKVKKTFKKD
jgi:hypothetical protein